jgi:dTDP-glucose pyrophosphorylase
MRLWRSQRVGVQTLIARLLADESDTFFVFDGRPEDAQVYRDIVECLPAGVRYADALHCSLWETLCWFKAADLGVMPHGAGCAMNIVADTPALLHTHASWQQLSIDDYANRASPGRDPRSSQRVDVTWEDETQDVYCRDYEIDIDDLCVKAIAMLRTFPSEAVILCGGKGTRLLSVVSDRPKPMANIFDRPFLDFVIDHFAAAGVRRFVLCAGHMGDQIEAYYRENPRGLDITVVTERELLGTAGAVKAAQAHIRSDVFFVANGDTLCPLDVRACAAQHRQHDAYATVAVSRVTQRSDAGVITRDGAGRIVAFDEKRPCDEAFVNAGVYLLTRSVFDRIPAGEKRSLEYDVFPAMAREGLLCAYTTDACFYDIGTPERLAVFKEYAAAQQKDCASRAHKL